MIFETYFKHVYLYVACLYATSGTGLYAQTLHQHAGTQRDTVPVTFPVQHLEEVVITAGRPGITAGAVSNRISSSEIHRVAGSSLATLLERISGVSSLSTGTTVSKPVIHGMHGNRILIINNGARQTGQQWATDHAPEVDINESGNILVIKGADGVRYGSDALGGIIVMEQPLWLSGRNTPKAESPHSTEVTGIAMRQPEAWKAHYLSSETSPGVCKGPIQIRETALRHIICSTIPEPEDYTSLHLRDMTAGDYGSKEYTATSANRRE